MEHADPKWYVVGIIIVVLLGIMIPRWFDGPVYSDEEGFRICSDVFAKYQTLLAVKAPPEQWDAFKQESKMLLGPMSEDHERHNKNDSSQKKAAGRLYQLAKYHLPKAIEQGNRPNGKSGAQAIETQLSDIKQIIFGPPPEFRMKGSGPSEQSGWDPLVVGILAMDVLIVVVGGGYWLLIR